MITPLDRATFIRPVAHRGLHDISSAIVENSPSAFAAALKGDYAIECDLRAAHDGVPMVFHDATLDRLMDATGRFDELSPAQLKRLRYQAADEGVLSFGEILELVNGRVPLMVELKTDWEAPDLSFLAQVADLARAYKGPIVFKAFDPDVMIALKHLVPGIPRGIVAGQFGKAGWWRESLGPCRRFCLSNLFYAFAVRPSFISYRLADLPTAAPVVARSVFKLQLFAWTVRSTDERARAAQLADAPIFEGYYP